MLFKKVDLKQGSDDWLAYRRSHIGASDAPSIMGKGFKTPVDLWKIKTGRSKESHPNAAMQRGIDLEPAARFACEIEIGRCLDPAVCVSKRKPFMIASLDGLSSDCKTAVEIKCPGHIDHQKALDGIIPEKYIFQLQHQLYVLGLEMMYYFSFDGKCGKVLEVCANEKLQNEMIEKEQQFFDCILNDTEPKLYDYKNIINENWLQLSNEWIQLRPEIETIKARLNELELREQNIKDSLVHLADKECAEGGGIRLHKTVRKGHVDYSKVPEIRGIDLEPYRKEPIESYRVEVI